ncbi:MAG: hypothetical protein Q8R36_05550 [bacterium]|nr:hypothetical protein [bacterium]
MATSTKYVFRFRFPKEIRHLLAYMIGKPAGSPSGDVGDVFVHEIEKAINEHTQCKDGKTIIGDGGNYPHISPDILVMFAVRWLRVVLKRIEKDENLRKRLFSAYPPEHIAQMLKKAAEAFEKFSATPK